MALKRDLKQMLDRLEQQGWTIERRHNNHLWLVGPSGQRVTSASTPSCYRGLLNLRAKLRREGAVL